MLCRRHRPAVDVAATALLLSLPRSYCCRPAAAAAALLLSLPRCCATTTALLLSP